MEEQKSKPHNEKRCTGSGSNKVSFDINLFFFFWWQDFEIHLIIYYCILGWIGLVVRKDTLGEGNV